MNVVEYSDLSDLATDNYRTACYYEIGVESPCDGFDTSKINLKFTKRDEGAYIIVKTAKSWESNVPKYLID